jgi:flavin-binding protein dodecin
VQKNILIHFSGSNQILNKGGHEMAESTYKVIEIVGSSNVSWEDAARVAVGAAGKSVKDLRIAEVVKMDMTIEDGKVALFRVRVTLSFKYHPED